jgi:hypothetical protein
VATPKIREWESKVTWAADFEYASNGEEKPRVQRELAKKTQTVAVRRKNSPEPTGSPKRETWTC